MSLKDNLYWKIFGLVRKANIIKYSKITDDKRSAPPFKLVYFCGSKGIDFLNASLFSVYKSWTVLPEVVIVSDGTPADVILSKIIRWPRNIEVISWETCALHFKDKGQINVYDYAVKELWGKKFVCIHYCAQMFPTLYCDTDVLWFKDVNKIDTSINPFIQMSQDVHVCYTQAILDTLNVNQYKDTTPFNAGVMYLNGNLSVYPNWEELSNYLALNRNLGGFSEQTANAVITNYFNPKQYWTANEILIKIADKYKFGYTKWKHKQIIARHYVNNKDITFWRDFAYMFLFS